MIYLDNASTTPINKEILSTYKEILDKYYANSESMHSLGQEVAKLVEFSRKKTAELLCVKEDEIYFTSGASEANSWAIKGIALAYQNQGKHLITSKIEHSSVLNAFKQLEELFGFEVTYLDVDESGIISLSQLESSLRSDTILCSLMQINNEVGTIQPIEEAARIIAKYPHCRFHVDMVQAATKYPCDLTYIDAATISAHKLNGLKGSGILMKKNNVNIIPLINGGAQEKGLRGGTMDSPSAMVFAKTLRIAREYNAKTYTNVVELNRYLREQLSKIDTVVINSIPQASPYILNFSCLTLPSEVHLNALNQEEICVSAQSTCGNRNHEYSYVLKAMGISSNRLTGAIRVSINGDTTKEEIEFFVQKVKENITKYGV